MSLEAMMTIVDKSYALYLACPLSSSARMRESERDDMCIQANKSLTYYETLGHTSTIPFFP